MVGSEHPADKQGDLRPISTVHFPVPPLQIISPASGPRAIYFEVFPYEICCSAISRRWAKSPYLILPLTYQVCKHKEPPEENAYSLFLPQPLVEISALLAWAEYHSHLQGPLYPFSETPETVSVIRVEVSGRIDLTCTQKMYNLETCVLTYVHYCVLPYYVHCCTVHIHNWYSGFVCCH